MRYILSKKSIKIWGIMNEYDLICRKWMMLSGGICKLQVLFKRMKEITETKYFMNLYINGCIDFNLRVDC